MLERTISRRDVLKGTAALAVTAGARAYGITPTAAAGAFPMLDIHVTDQAVELPETIQAGRYAVTVSYSGEIGSHLSIGRFPDAFSAERIALVFDDDPTNDGTTEEFFSIEFVGLPDWPLSGRSVSGIVDLAAGDYLVIDPISSRPPQRLLVEGDAGPAGDPVSDVSLVMREMALDLSSETVPSGSHLWKITNDGAFTHEFAVLPVKEGTTNEDLATYVSWAMEQPEEGSPTSAPPTGDKIDLMTYQPLAAMSLLRPGGVSWVHVDLPTGSYALLCMVPGPTDEMPPHALMGMHAVFQVA